MLADLQIHSTMSRCAEPTMTIQTIVNKACDMGLAGIGLTDHIHQGTYPPKIINHHRDQLKTIELRYPLNVWIGLEVDIVDNTGTMACSSESLLRADYVLAGVHHFHLPWVDSPTLDRKRDDILSFAHKQLLGAVRNPAVHAIAHPWVALPKYLKGFSFSWEHVSQERILELGYEARKYGTGIEIPAWALWQTEQANEVYISGFVQPLTSTGCPVFVGTDAHTPSAIGKRVADSYLLLQSLGAQCFWTP